jgi:UDP-N-acetylmuramate dehydrogenase
LSTGKQTLRTDLESEGFRGELSDSCPLAPHTTWRIGGPAELLAVPVDRDDLALAVTWASKRGVRWRILGNGSNLLVRDEGVRGLVVRVRKIMDDVAIEGRTLTAGAGALFPSVANQAAAAGLAGIEFGAGIPGTIGGAIVMNAGWHEHEIGNFVEQVEYLDPDGTVAVRSRDESEFRYRGSRFLGQAGVVLSATLRLEPGDPRQIRSRLEHFAESRKQNQPTDQPSCGSVFVQPPGDFAGRLIEQAGLKGLRLGDVEVSRKHANFFVNVGNATATDVLTVVEQVETEVERRFGVKLQREFELWE